MDVIIHKKYVPSKAGFTPLATRIAADRSAIKKQHVTATGFTQSRYTLYDYYISFFLYFQRSFCTNSSCLYTGKFYSRFSEEKILC